MRRSRARVPLVRSFLRAGGHGSHSLPTASSYCNGVSALSTNYNTACENNGKWVRPDTEEWRVGEAYFWILNCAFWQLCIPLVLQSYSEYCTEYCSPLPTQNTYVRRTSGTSTPRLSRVQVVVFPLSLVFKFIEANSIKQSCTVLVNRRGVWVLTLEQCFDHQGSRH